MIPVIAAFISVGCLSHKTAVAAGALSQYLRFLVDPGPQEYRRVVRVDGPNHMLHSVGGHPHQFGPSEQENHDNRVMMENHDTKVMAGGQGNVGNLDRPDMLGQPNGFVTENQKSPGVMKMGQDSRGNRVVMQNRQDNEVLRADGNGAMMQSKRGDEEQDEEEVVLNENGNIEAGGVLGQIKPPLGLMQRGVQEQQQGVGAGVERGEDGAGDADEDNEDPEDLQNEEELEVELNDPPLEPINKNQIIDDNDETIHIDPNEENENEENDEYDDSYDDNNNEDEEDEKYADDVNANEDEKYDDENYDKDEGGQSRDKLALQNQAHINPKFQRRRVDLNIRENQNDAKTHLPDHYEQYLDGEEVLNEVENDNKEKLQLLPPKSLNAAHLQHKKFDGREANDDVDQGYNYYMNKDELNENSEDKEKQEALTEKDGGGGKYSNIYPEKKRGTELDSSSEHFMHAQNTNQIGKAYLLLLLTMCGLMYLMYRFVKQRRIVIKYHHRSYYKW